MWQRARLIVGIVLIVALGGACAGSGDAASEDADAPPAETTTTTTAVPAVEAPAVDDAAGDVSDETTGVDDSNASVSRVLIGTRTELPPDFRIPAPGGGEIVSAFESNEMFVASVTYGDGLIDEVVVFYQDWAATTGEDWASWDNEFMEGDTPRRQAVWTDDPDAPGAVTATTVTVGTCNDNREAADGGQATCVYISETKSG